MTFFSSDHHFDHKNIIEYCNRPFLSIEDMNDKLISNWNNIVSQEDTIFYLGDFALSSMDRIATILSKLNGHKILIKGNHDRHSTKKYTEAGFSSIYQKLNFDRFLLTHRPETRNEDFEGQWNLCGHVHEKWKLNFKKRILNVGIDVWNFEPISLNTILSEISL